MTKLMQSYRSIGTHAAAAVIGASVVAAAVAAQGQKPEVLPHVIGYKPENPVHIGQVLTPVNIGDTYIGELSAVGFQDGSRTIGHVTLDDKYTLFAIADPNGNQSLACVYQRTFDNLGQPVAGALSVDGKPQFFVQGSDDNPGLEAVCRAQAQNIAGLYEKAAVPSR